jgi:hypothetical protein
MFTLFFFPLKQLAPATQWDNYFAATTVLRRRRFIAAATTVSKLAREGMRFLKPNRLNRERRRRRQNTEEQ